MLGLLIAKDLRRTFRNPWPWIMNLALPIAITAVIGFVFGGGAGKTGNSQVRVKFAVVDEDKSFLSGALRSMLTQGDAAQHLDPLFLDRAEALRTLRDNKISALLVIPTNFTKSYLEGQTNLALEVIKNPAQFYAPAIIEEMAEVAVTALNAIERNFTSEFPKLRNATTNSANWDFDIVSDSVRRIGARIKAARAYLDPPLVSYTKEENKEAPTVAVADPSKPEPPKPKPSDAPSRPTKLSRSKSIIVEVFAWILPGMASAFLLFMADQSMRDFHREIRMKTFARQRTVGVGAGVYIASKIVFTALTVMIASVILFTGGALVFGVEWTRPGLLALACAGYALFAAGLMAALIALSPNERRTEVMNSMLLFAIAFVGGSYMPSDQFPQFMREHITTLMPNHWLIETARALQRTDVDYTDPLYVVLKLALAGVILGCIAAAFINRRLRV